MASRGYKITKESGETIAKNNRRQRFKNTSQRAQQHAVFEGVKHYLTPTGGIPAFDEGTDTMGSAECVWLQCDQNGTFVPTDITEFVFSLGNAVIPEGIRIAALRNDAGLMEAIVEPC